MTLDLNSPLYNNFKISNPFNKTLKLVGEDVGEYLQRQLTSDINALEDYSSQMSSRLDRAGRVHSFFYVLKSPDAYFILLNESMLESVKEELEKFLFAEDVELSISDSFNLYVGPTIEMAKGHDYRASWCDLDAVFSKDKKDFKLLSNKKQEELIYLTGWPVYEKTQNLNILVNNSRLNELAVSYSKGCFLGQETAAKVETRRGASKFPCLVSSSNEKLVIDGIKTEQVKRLEIDNLFYYYIELPREFRVDGKKINEDSQVHLLPALKGLNKEKRVEELFYKAVELYHEDKGMEAIELLDLAIEIVPSYADAYETKGVIYGHLNKFDDAISSMDDLLEKDPDSVMAHTNKSLYLMKQGKLEEAEEEKSLATLASFKKLGDEAKKKKEVEQLQKQERDDLVRKKEMFLQVLELDEDDELANFGIAEYYYKFNEFDKALKHVKKVVDNNEKYSVGYLLLGKVYEALKEEEKAVQIYQKGIDVASKNGDMMPANEMQQKLNMINS